MNKLNLTNNGDIHINIKVSNHLVCTKEELQLISKKDSILHFKENIYRYIKAIVVSIIILIKHLN